MDGDRQARGGGDHARRRAVLFHSGRIQPVRSAVIGVGNFRIAALPALFSAAALLAGLPAGAQAQDDELGLPTGTPAPDAQVEDLDGNTVSLLDVVGSGPALIEFWASWCEQCELLQPQIDEIQERFAERIKVVAVAVAVNQSVRRVRRHVDRHAPGYAFVYDAQGEAVRAYQALTTSIVVLIDGEGRIVSTGVGPQQPLVEAVEEMLGAAAGQS
ncbi:MAG: redoxin family protein [Gemmatimonadetes bacterium]|nr:redoxin family protein [Gemmatimonadota bacterium]MYE14954.1 redoxin family protein [Gemmatimonadota bacterium]